MYKQQIKEILQDIRENKINVDDAVEKLKNLPFEDIGFAKIDHHRAIRRGFPEVVFCQNKSVKQVAEIVKRMAANNDALATRATKEMFDAVRKDFKNAQYNEMARTITIKNNDSGLNKKISNIKKNNNNKNLKKKKNNSKKVIVISAGTSDIPVAEEAAITAEMFGSDVERLYDVGVAGIHRLLSHKEKIEAADVLIVV